MEKSWGFQSRYASVLVPATEHRLAGAGRRFRGTGSRFPLRRGLGLVDLERIAECFARASRCDVVFACSGRNARSNVGFSEAVLLLGAGLGSLSAGALVQVSGAAVGLIVWGLGLGVFGGLMLVGQTNPGGE